MEKVNLKTDGKKLLEKNFQKEKMNPQMQNLIKKVKISEDDAKRNLSSLQDTICELNRCKNCPGLSKCENISKGHVYYPNVNESILTFDFIPCKKLKDLEKKTAENNANNVLENARMKDIDASDKARAKLIKWLMAFYKNYDLGKFNKGLYLHGSFGSGKTFLVSALFNELKTNYDVKYEIVYFPELLRNLKDDFALVDSKVGYLSSVDLLLIDDIGAEKVSDWGRDEILGTILQYRMNNHLTTFFTSNLNINELEKHLSMSKDSIDSVKARRIIERVKQLSENMELISINRRN